MQSNSLQARYIGKVERGTGAHGSAHLQISEFLSRTTILRAAGPEPTRNHHAETGGPLRNDPEADLFLARIPTSLQTFMHAREKGGGVVAPDLCHSSKCNRPFAFVRREFLEIVEDAADAFRGIMNAGRYEEIGFVQGQMSVQ